MLTETKTFKIWMDGWMLYKNTQRGCKMEKSKNIWGIFCRFFMLQLSLLFAIIKLCTKYCICLVSICTTVLNYKSMFLIKRINISFIHSFIQQSHMPRSCQHCSRSVLAQDKSDRSSFINQSSTWGTSWMGTAALSFC